MRIPTPSDVLIVGVTPVSLGFAVLLAKGGLNVLVVDEAETQTFAEPKKLDLSVYTAEILKQHGFKLDDETTEDDFIEQSLNLLAHNLCNVVWETRFANSKNEEHQLVQNAVTQNHKSSFVFKLGDLEVEQANAEANFRSAFVLAWRVIGVKLERLHPFILHSYENEKKLIAEFYQHKKPTSIFGRWLQKLISAQPTDLQLIDSPINLHLSQQRILQAGDLLPNLPFYDEKSKKESSLYHWCSYQHFSLIVVGSLNAQYLFNIAKWVQLNFNVKLFYLPYSEKNESVFKTLAISPKEKRTFMIRPDRFISLISDTVETDIIDNYLRNVLMMNANAEKS